VLPPRLAPLLQQFDFARRCLTERMAGPAMDNGDGMEIRVGPLTDEEYFWEPVPRTTALTPSPAPVLCSPSSAAAAGPRGGSVTVGCGRRVRVRAARGAGAGRGRRRPMPPVPVASCSRSEVRSAVDADLGAGDELSVP
jgi:hypothetical protein